MPAPTSADDLLELIRKSGLVEPPALTNWLAAHPAVPTDARGLGKSLSDAGLLTSFQLGLLLKGKWKNFILAGKYRLLDHLGTGGMGSVYLCEHTVMHRRVAVKVLPVQKDPSAVERFKREARAIAALDHPNIVRAFDIDSVDNIHFLIMEFVDGTSLQHLVVHRQPLSIERACHYITQAAYGLHHAHEAGLVHRDIKPGNLLLSRDGTVKVLDMGLARFTEADDNFTRKHEQNTILGTADYLAPEQAVDSSNVDRRADVYSLGATFFFLLAGKTPFGEGPISQKILRHQSGSPPSIRAVRPEVPANLAAVLERMMAKDPAKRYPTALATAEALAPWTRSPIPPPGVDEMPAARTGGPTTGTASNANSPHSGASGPSMTPSTLPSRGLLPAGSSRTNLPATTRTRRPLGVGSLLGLAMLIGLTVGVALAGVWLLVPGLWPISQDGGHTVTPRSTEPTPHPDPDPVTPPIPKTGDELLPLPSTLRLARNYVGQAGAVTALTTAGNGNLFAGGEDGSVRVWHMYNPQLNHEFKGHTGPVTAVTTDRGGRRLVSGGRDGTIRLWDVDGKKELASWDAKAGPIRSIALSGDGKMIATGSDDGSIRCWDVAGKELTRLTGHTGTVTGLNWAADNKHLLSASADKTARFWNTMESRQVRQFNGHTDRINTLTLAPDGGKFLTCSADQTVRLWEASTGRELSRFDAGAEVASVGWSPDSRRLVLSIGKDVRITTMTGDPLITIPNGAMGVFTSEGRVFTARADRAVSLWQVDATIFDTFEVRRYPGNTLALERVAVSPDGRRLAAVGLDARVHVWETDTGRETHSFEGHEGVIHWVTFDPTGDRLATGGVDSTLRVWHLGDRRELWKVRAHLGTVWGVSWSRDGSRIATSGDDHLAKLWDAGTGKPIREFQGHTNTINAIAFAPDGKTLATASWDWSARLWDTETGQEIRQWAGHGDAVSAVAFSPDGTILATGGKDNMVRLWNPVDGKPLATLRADFSPWSLAFSADGTTLAASGESSAVRFWDVAKRQRTAGVYVGGTQVPGGVFLPDGRYVTVSLDGAVILWQTQPEASTPVAVRQFPDGLIHAVCMAASPDGSVAVAGNWDGVVTFWETGTGRLKQEFRGHAKSVRSLALTDIRQRLATGSEDGTIRLWELDRKDASRELPGHGPKQSVLALAFSPDGGTLLSGGADGRVIVWDSETGQQRKEMLVTDKAIFAVAWLSDGKRFVVASNDGLARLWDLEAGEVRRYEGHKVGLRSLALSADGSRMVTGDMNGGVRLWEVELAKPLGVFASAGMIRGVAFGPDGQTVLATSNNVIQRWDLSGRGLQPLRRHPNQTLAVFAVGKDRVLSLGYEGVIVWQGR